MNLRQLLKHYLHLGMNKGGEMLFTSRTALALCDDLLTLEEVHELPGPFFDQFSIWRLVRSPSTNTLGIQEDLGDDWVAFAANFNHLDGSARQEIEVMKQAINNRSPETEYISLHFSIPWSEIRAE